MILYPDQRIKDQPENETVCFAAPIDKCDWDFLYARAKKNVLTNTGMRFVIIVGDHDTAPVDSDEFTEVYFMRNNQEITDRVCIVLRENEDADKCLESAAWIRIQENYPGMIYICRGSTRADKWQKYSSALGAPQEYVCMVDFHVVPQE